VLWTAASESAAYVAVVWFSWFWSRIEPIRIFIDYDDSGRIVRDVLYQGNAVSLAHRDAVELQFVVSQQARRWRYTDNELSVRRPQPWPAPHLGRQGLTPSAPEQPPVWDYVANPWGTPDV
jgi:hypothetical protein